MMYVTITILIGKENYLVIGIQKRYDPSKTYYFIMDVVWSDGSQLMIYRLGQDIIIMQIGRLDIFLLAKSSK